MQPYHEAHGCTLYLGESLDVLRSLPDESVDALITDPPYSSGGLMRADRVTASTSDKYVSDGTWIKRLDFAGDNRDGRSWAYWSALWLSECLRIVKHGGYGLMFTDWRQLPTATDAFQGGGFIWRGIIAWDKGEGARAPHKGYFRHQCEYVVWGSKGILKAADWDGPWSGCVHESVKPSDKHHITGKPTPLMSRLIRCVPPGGTVLDPFAGSGTTLVAAANAGRKAIGIETLEGNCEIAAKRLDSLTLPLVTV